MPTFTPVEHDPFAVASPGLLAAGNIDLHNRPRVRNADGSISTVRSISANFDGQEVLIPTVSDDGRVMSDDEAMEQYRRTGRHLGKFATPEAATAFAESLHNQQADEYVPSAAKLTPVDFDPFEERSLGDAFGDAWTRGKQGLNNVAAGMVGIPTNLANLVAGSPMMRMIDRAAGRETTLFEQPDAVRGIRESLAINSAEDEAGLTDRARAQAAGFQAADGFVPSLEYLLKNPSFLATEAAAQLPQFLQIVPGSLPATIAAQATGAASQNAQQSEEALRARGASEQDAAAAAADTFAPSLAINSLLPMLPGGSAIERVLAGQAGKGVAREGASRLGLILKALAGETGTEAAQEGLDQAVQNIATDAPIGQGVGQASALGALLGAPGGVAAGSVDAMMLPQGKPAAPPALPPAQAPDAQAPAPADLMTALLDAVPPEAQGDLDALLSAIRSPPPAPATNPTPDAPPAAEPGAAATLPPVEPVLDTPAPLTPEAPRGTTQPEQLPPDPQAAVEGDPAGAVPVARAVNAPTAVYQHVMPDGSVVEREGPRALTAMEERQIEDPAQAMPDESTDNSAREAQIADAVGRGLTPERYVVKERRLPAAQGGEYVREYGWQFRIDDKTTLPITEEERAAIGEIPSADAAPDAALAQEETPEISPDDLSPTELASYRRSTGQDEAVDFLRTESERQGNEDADAFGLRDAVKAAVGDSEVTFLRDEDGLPASVKVRKKPKGAVRKGLYDPATKRVYVFTDGARTPEDAAFTAAHEIAGHKGLRSLAESNPDVKVGNKTAKQALNDALEMALQNPTVAAVADSMSRQRQSADRLLMAEEAIADIAAATRTGDWSKVEAKHGTKVPEAARAGMKSAVAQFVERMRRILNALVAKWTGKPGKFTDAQVHELIENAWQAGRESEGKPARVAESEPALEQGGDQTQTPAFRKWFGESKVVDEAGQPLRVFHGTTGNFDAFDPAKRGKATAHATAKLGEFFSASPEIANEFIPDSPSQSYTAGGNVLPVYLSVKNPYRGFHPQEFESLISRNDPKEVADLRTELEQKGYDGIFIRGTEDGPDELRSDTWISFHPEQIKSATGNRGTFDPENPSILYSDEPALDSVESDDRVRAARARADAKREVARDTLGGPTTGGAVGWNFETGQWEGRAGTMRRARAALDDKMIAWRDVQETIAAKLGDTIPDAQNVYRLENLMHGRVKEGIDALESGTIEPLIKAMRAAKVEPKALEEYLYARHAKERNAQIAKINPKMPDGGSGMTNAEADAILAKPAPPADIVRMVDAITRQTRRRLLTHGLITREQFDAMEAQYSAYVPLRGKRVKENDFDAGQGSGAGRGIDGRPSPVKQALGRGAGNRAENILGEIIGDAQRSIIAAEKARVGRAVLRLVLANPNPNLWTVEPVQTERKLDAAGEVYEAVVNDWSDPSLVAVRHRGQLYKVQIEHAPLAQALNLVGIDQLGAVTRAAGTLNRYFSAVLTRYNPAFIPVNATRDALFGLTGMAVEHGEYAAAQAAAYYPKAMRAAWRESRRLPPKSKADQYAREFAEDGGKTGYVNMPSVEELQRKIGTGKLTSYSPDGLAKVTRTLGDIVGAMNDAIENALRLSAYVVLRERGMSREASAAYAKDLTVNFNRKGSEGTKLNSWFLFYNASMQGAKRVSTLAKHPKTWGYLSALTAMQVAAVYYAMGQEDDDGTALWDKIPDHVKQRNIVLTWRNDKGEQHLVTIPMPYGFNLMPYVAGRIAEAVMHPDDRPNDRAVAVAADALSAAVQSFSPVPLDDGALGLVPTAIRIPLSIQNNKDDFGRPIRKENPYAKFDPPRASMGKPDTLEIFKVLAKGLNRLGGGDDRTPPPMSAFDRAPEDIEYILNKLGGGAGKFLVDVATLGQKAAGDAPVEAKDIPILKRFYTNTDEPAAQQSMFYDRREVIERDADHVRDVFESSGEEAALALLKAKPSLTGADFRRYKRTEKGHKKGQIILTEGRPQLVAKGDTLYAKYKAAAKATTSINESIRNAYTSAPMTLAPNRERDRAIRELTKQRQDAQRAFNAEWNRVVVDAE